MDMNVYLTRSIERARLEHPKDDNEQCKTFIQLMRFQKPSFDCSVERYQKIRKLLFRTKSPFREFIDHIAYENSVNELLSMPVPIMLI